MDPAHLFSGVKCPLPHWNSTGDTRLGSQKPQKNDTALEKINYEKNNLSRLLQGIIHSV